MRPVCSPAAHQTTRVPRMNGHEATPEGPAQKRRRLDPDIHEIDLDTVKLWCSAHGDGRTVSCPLVMLATTPRPSPSPGEARGAEDYDHAEFCR